MLLCRWNIRNVQTPVSNAAVQHRATVYAVARAHASHSRSHSLSLSLLSVPPKRPATGPRSAAQLRVGTASADKQPTGCQQHTRTNTHNARCPAKPRRHGTTRYGYTAASSARIHARRYISGGLRMGAVCGWSVWLVLFGCSCRVVKRRRRRRFSVLCSRMLFAAGCTNRSCSFGLRCFCACFVGGKNMFCMEYVGPHTAHVSIYRHIYIYVLYVK